MRNLWLLTFNLKLFLSYFSLTLRLVASCRVVQQYNMSRTVDRQLSTEQRWWISTSDGILECFMIPTVCYCWLKVLHPTRVLLLITDIFISANLGLVLKTPKLEQFTRKHTHAGDCLESKCRYRGLQENHSHREYWYCNVGRVPWFLNISVILYHDCDFCRNLQKSSMWMCVRCCSIVFFHRVWPVYYLTWLSSWFLDFLPWFYCSLTDTVMLPVCVQL